MSIIHATLKKVLSGITFFFAGDQWHGDFITRVLKRNSRSWNVPPAAYRRAAVTIRLEDIK